MHQCVICGSVNTLPSKFSVVRSTGTPERSGSSAHGDSDQQPLAATWKQLSHAISTGTGHLVDKIKRAASQPALATVQHASFADAADAVVRHSPSPLPGGGAAMGGVDLLSKGLKPVVRRDSKKSE